MDPPQTRTVLTWEALRNRAHVGTLAPRGPDVVQSQRKRGITRGDVETPIGTAWARASTKWTGAKAVRVHYRPPRSLARADAPGYRSDGSNRVGPTEGQGDWPSENGTGRRVEMIVIESRFEIK